MESVACHDVFSPLYTQARFSVRKTFCTRCAFYIIMKSCFTRNILDDFKIAKTDICKAYIQWVLGTLTQDVASWRCYFFPLTSYTELFNPFAGWIEPLLDRIKKNPTNVVCPVIDVIGDDTFEYHYAKAYFTNVGGFDWSLQFNWHAIPDRDRKNRRHIDPVKWVTIISSLSS